MLDIDIWNIAFTVVNLLVLVFLMKRILFKPITKIMEERTQQVKKQMDDAEQAKQEAQQLKSEYEKNVSGAKLEASRIIDNAKKRAGEIESQSQAQAQAQANRIIAQANMQIQQEKELAISQAQSQIAQVAIAAASRVMQANADNQSSYDAIDEYLNEVGVNK